MPNLDKWIEAQLKRGYSRKQIKSALIRKGYSPKVVAEVDKVEVSPLQKKQFYKKFPNLFILVILIIGIILVVWFLLPSSQKQGETAKLQTDEQAANEEILSIEEKRLMEAKAAEEAKEALKDFNSDFCKNLMPENIRNIPLSEYALNHHIDGSKGENIRWSASEQPKGEFSPFEGPQVFFVSGNEFEGCGYKQEVEAKGIKTELRDKYGLPYLCNGKEVYLIQKIYESYAVMSFYQPESEDKAIALKISIKPEFGNKEQVLTSMGCEI